jgi:addiction module HigA family antidote
MVESRHEYSPSVVVPPGMTISETIEALGLSQGELAARLGMSLPTINKIVNGRAPITPETALGLERVLGISAIFWNRYEAAYRDFLFRQEESERMEEERSIWKAHSLKLVIDAMVKVGMIPRKESELAQREEVLRFFGIASFKQYQPLLAVATSRYRLAKAFESDPDAVHAWLRQGEWIAKTIECKPFSAAKLKKTLNKMRDLTVRNANSMQSELVNLCAECGVALVFVPELSGTHLYGAARWVNPDKALVQLSLKDFTNDQLWFSFFHEIGHILLHRKRDAFLDAPGDGSGNEAEEHEADVFSSELLIKPEHLSRFLVEHPRPSKDDLQRFAARINLHVGVVVGRLQSMGLLSTEFGNELKVIYRWQGRG